MDSIDHYIYIIYDWHSLYKLPILTIKDIETKINDERYYFNEIQRMYFHCYYGYFNKLKDYIYKEINTLLCEYNRNRISSIRTNNLYLMAAYTGNIKIMRYLEKHKINIHYKNDYQWNALMYAASNGKIKVIKYLIKRGFNINVMDIFKQKIYNIASKYGHLNTLKYLDNHGYSLYIAKMDSYIYLNPMYNAAINNNFKIMKYFNKKGITFKRNTCLIKYYEFLYHTNNKPLTFKFNIPKFYNYKMCFIIGHA